MTLSLPHPHVGNPNVEANFRRIAEQVGKHSTSVANVKTDFGAKGDGTGDDAGPIWAACNALKGTGGIVYLPPGTYKVSPFLNPAGFGGYYAGVWIPSHVTIVGAGKTTSVIKLKSGLDTSGMANGCAIVSNLHLATITDTGGGIQDLGVDGDAANQSGTNYAYGSTWMRTDGYEVRRCRFKNVYGTGSSGAAETFHCYSQLSGNNKVFDSECISDSGQTASGFGDVYNTNMHYANSYATGMINGGGGFCSNQSTNVKHSHCDSFANSTTGFLYEECDAVMESCRSGGKAQDTSGNNPKPYTDAQNLRNGVYGVVNTDGRVRIANSDISENVTAGIVCNGSTASIEVSNNNVENNGQNYQFIAGASAANSTGVTLSGTATLTWPGGTTRSTALNITHAWGGFSPTRFRATAWQLSDGKAAYVLNTFSNANNVQFTGVSTEGNPANGVTAVISYEVEF